MAIIVGNQKCLSWSDDPDCEEFWDGTIFTWSDCILIQVALPGAVGRHVPPSWVTGSLDDLHERDKSRKKRLIQLVTYVKEDTLIEESEIKDISLTVDDVELVKNYMEKKLKIEILR